MALTNGKVGALYVICATIVYNCIHMSKHYFHLHLIQFHKIQSIDYSQTNTGKQSLIRKHCPKTDKFSNIYIMNK